MCPITQMVFTDPVIASDGQSYERAAIEQWLDTGHTTSPATNRRLPDRKLVPNHALRSAAAAYTEATRAAAEGRR